MRSVHVTGPGRAEWVDVDEPVVGAHDVLLRMKACGICGSDLFYIQNGGIPPRTGTAPLGHEPAGEVAALGTEIEHLRIGDHVIVDKVAGTEGLLGGGGTQGALSEYVVIRDVVPGTQVKVIPHQIPWEVAALTEPMAVALHAVNRTQPPEDAKVVVFGAGPIGLGSVLGYRRRGASHIVVVDVVPSRLETALKLGADAVVNAAEEDVAQRLADLHGDGSGLHTPGVRPATDVYLDAAGVPAVPETVAGIARHGATLGIVALHKSPVTLDFGRILTTELTVVWAMGYPTEVFEVADDIIENWERYAQIVSHTFPFAEALEALEFAGSTAEVSKVVVVFD